jgi:hypothetical protein
MAASCACGPSQEHHGNEHSVRAVRCDLRRRDKPAHQSESEPHAGGPDQQTGRVHGEDSVAVSPTHGGSAAHGAGGGRAAPLGRGLQLRAPRRRAEHRGRLPPFTATNPEHGRTRSELAEHIRDEHSTFTWLLEAMIERADFAIAAAELQPGPNGRALRLHTALTV